MRNNAAIAPLLRATDTEPGRRCTIGYGRRMPYLVEPILDAGTISSSPLPTLTIDANLALRPFVPSDAHAVVRAYSDPDIQRWHGLSIDSIDEATRWIERANELWTEGKSAVLAVVNSRDAVLGRCAIHIDTRRGIAEIAYWVLPEARRTGVAVKAATAVTAWAHESLGVRRILLQHSVQNTASCAVANRVGYFVEGTARRQDVHVDGWHDMHQHAHLPGDPLGPDAMSGGWQTTVQRDGETVRRVANPWSRSVIALLEHLESAGFEGAPRPIGDGIDDGSEVLTFVPGSSPQPSPWSDDALTAIGEMLGDLHRATASFAPSSDAIWRDGVQRTLGTPSLGFGHGDLGPWNIMAIEGRPTGFIDWDTAGPIDPLYDLAYAAWLNVQLHDDDIAERVGLSNAVDRVRQLRLFLDGYGLATGDRERFVEVMIEVAVAHAAAEAIEHEVVPETTNGTAPNGYPVVWGIAWRTRSAAWMLRHRSMLTAAITSISNR